jgi:hypothetical protein
LIWPVWRLCITANSLENHFVETEIDGKRLIQQFSDFVEAGKCPPTFALVTHDCLRQQYVQLPDSNYRGIQSLAIRRTPALSPWLHNSSDLKKEDLEIHVNSNSLCLCF